MELFANQPRRSQESLKHQAEVDLLKILGTENKDAVLEAVNLFFCGCKAEEKDQEIVISVTSLFALMFKTYVINEEPFPLQPGLVLKTVLKFFVNQRHLDFSKLDPIEKEFLLTMADGGFANKDQLYTLYEKYSHLPIDEAIVTRAYLDAHFGVELSLVSLNIVDWVRVLRWREVLLHDRLKSTGLGTYLALLEKPHDPNVFAFTVAHLEIKRLEALTYYYPDQLTAFGLLVAHDILKVLMSPSGLNKEILQDIIEQAEQAIKQNRQPRTPDLPPVSIGLEFECLYNGIWSTGLVSQQEVIDFIDILPKTSRSGFAQSWSEELNEKIMPASRKHIENMTLLQLVGIENDQMSAVREGRMSYEYSLPPVQHVSNLKIILDQLELLGFYSFDPAVLVKMKRIMDVNWGADLDFSSTRETKALQIAFVAAGLLGTGFLGAGAEENVESLMRANQDGYKVKTINSLSKLVKMLGGKKFQEDTNFERFSIFSRHSFEVQSLTAVENKAGELVTKELLLEAVNLMFPLVRAVLVHQIYVKEGIHTPQGLGNEQSLELYIERNQLHVADIQVVAWVYFREKLQAIFEKHGLPSPIYDFGEISSYFSYLPSKINIEYDYSIGFTLLAAKLFKVFHPNAQGETFTAEELISYENPPTGSFPAEIRELIAEVVGVLHQF